MQLSRQFRAAGRKLLGPDVARYVRRCFHKKLPQTNAYRSLLARKRGLEIGGPSALFTDEGSLPLYRVLQSLDNCLYSSRTIWTGSVQEGGTFVFHPRKSPGKQIICEASDLKPVEDASYECVLASHCLEHVANPLRALAEWRRVLKTEGLLLLILPHKDGTFDWRRPTTSVAHMISDYENNVGEDDLSHLPEILELHDLERDKAAGSREQFRLRCLENYDNRAMHHHVFDTHTAVALINQAKFQVIRVDNFLPYNIMILASRCASPPDNAAFLGFQAEYRQGSPFPSDRHSAGRHG